MCKDSTLYLIYQTSFAYTGRSVIIFCDLSFHKKNFISLKSGFLFQLTLLTKLWCLHARINHSSLILDRHVFQKMWFILSIKTFHANRTQFIFYYTVKVTKCHSNENDTNFERSLMNDEKSLYFIVRYLKGIAWFEMCFQGRIRVSKLMLAKCDWIDENERCFHDSKLTLYTYRHL